MSGKGSSKTADGSSVTDTAVPDSAADLERMMAELGLREEDLDDVLYDDQEAPPETTRWIAVVSPPPKRDPRRPRINQEGKEGDNTPAKKSLVGS